MARELSHQQNERKFPRMSPLWCFWNVFDATQSLSRLTSSKNRERRNDISQEKRFFTDPRRWISDDVKSSDCSILQCGTCVSSHVFVLSMRWKECDNRFDQWIIRHSARLHILRGNSRFLFCKNFIQLLFLFFFFLQCSRVTHITSVSRSLDISIQQLIRSIFSHKKLLIGVN